jgi:hypothetical protein
MCIRDRDIEKRERAEQMKPGSPCPKRFLASSKEYSEKPLCTASITYLNKKMNELKEKYGDTEEFKTEYAKVTEKVCLCEGLSAATFIINEIETPKWSRAVAICPGPNLAYFNKVTNLQEMTDHIYGRVNLISHPNRPNLFIKELTLYMNYFLDKIAELANNLNSQTAAFLTAFRKNLLDGISYYKGLLAELKEESEETKDKMFAALTQYEQQLLSLAISVAA